MYLNKIIEKFIINYIQVHTINSFSFTIGLYQTCDITFFQKKIKWINSFGRGRISWCAQFGRLCSVCDLFPKAHKTYKTYSSVSNVQNNPKAIVHVCVPSKKRCMCVSRMWSWCKVCIIYWDAPRCSCSETREVFVVGCCGNIDGLWNCEQYMPWRTELHLMLTHLRLLFTEVTLWSIFVYHISRLLSHVCGVPWM